MHFTPLALLSLLGAAQAAATPKILSFDDVIVPSDDGKSFSVMKTWEYGIQESKREMLNKRAGYAPPSLPAAGALDRRCDETTEVQVTSDTSFNNWDVAMSPVIANTGSETALVSVSKGYEIGNSISITESVSYTIIPAVLKMSFSITYTTTWTTTDSETFNFWVPPGQNGLVVSQPLVRRITGNYVTGCTDSPKYEPFTADSYDSQDYNGMSWVRGPILLCNSTEYPVPFCNGQGVHK
ncbi:hypothetical protein KVR01_012874 [Diaporthe batatas]|uniref:uncharacterized protein n=1 Tax=Diaporthe batatas TaxID=748121 RepID=UPI001D038E2A|nr:uncharacterized protein KVR01_012874 [Diaporthe batatas]KAG8157166.1 hypothetical protein KVR01_012874 [Diaporthe batatas]